MLNSFYGLDRLDSGAALAAALVIGFFFGLALENAGFGSSRRLAGIFYFRDMTVLKVMFTGVIVAMLGVCYLDEFGLISLENVFKMPTIYAAQIVGGLAFGVGFVMSGWCPGTAAVGLASGSLDALVFLGGALGGSILFNESFPLLKSVYTGGDVGVSFAYEKLGMSRAAFAFVFTVVAVVAFWAAEIVERLVSRTGKYLGSRFLPAFSLILVLAAAGLFVFPAAPRSAVVGAGASAGSVAMVTEAGLLAAIEAGADHIEPEEVADRLMASDPGLLVVDVRPAAEFAVFHLRGAVHAALPDLPALAAANRDKNAIVLYSNGMTHPAEARDSLARLGHANVYLMTDGLAGFTERCIKPVSLRIDPPSAETTLRIQAWRDFFLSPGKPAPAVPAAAETASTVALPPGPLPGLVQIDWLAANLGRTGLKVLDVRPQPEYNAGHIPGALSVNVENFRGLVGGVPSMLLPPSMLAAQLSLLGIAREDLVVICGGDKLHDATLVSMVFARLGHERYALLQGGYPAWIAEKRPTDKLLPAVAVSEYRASWGADRFTVDAAQLQRLQTQGAAIVDVRPADYFAGRKSDEARAGHIPGAVNRVFSDDAVKGVAEYKPLPELASVYTSLLPDRNRPVVVHCRTGHQASQTYFLLKNLLGYKQVFWYDGGWTEWTSRPDLPVAVEGTP